MEQYKDNGFLDEEGFLSWCRKNDSERKLTESDYKLLFRYLKGHGYALCADSEKCLYRVDIEDDGTILYSIDEMIKEVSALNNRLLISYGTSLKIVDISSEEERNIRQVMKKLEVREKDLERMYLTTKISRIIKLACEKIVREE